MKNDVYLYRKGISAEVDATFQTANPYGSIRLSKDRVFWSKMLKWYSLPLDQVSRAWRRIEQVNGKTGCCSNDFSMHFLILVLQDGTELKIRIGDSLYRHEPEALLAQLAEEHPGISIGKTEG